MFDDQLKNLGQVPNNLPAEPADIFASTDELNIEETKNEESTVTAGNSALGAGILKPKLTKLVDSLPVDDHPVFSTSPVAGEIPLENDQIGSGETYTLKAPTMTRWIIIILVVGLVVGGGVFGYTQYKKQTNKVVTPVSILENNGVATSVVDNNKNSVDLPEAGVLSNNEQTVTTNDEQILFGQAIDTDGDGLDDQTEIKLSLDPNNWDTDDDNLSDGDEVKIWKTDPLKVDTDGDTYNDGDEVKNGYSPNGSGKLFELPTSTEG